MPKPVLWQCDYCHREYESQRRAREHEQDKHEEPPILTDGGQPAPPLFKCLRCGDVHRRLGDVEADRGRCPECGEEGLLTRVDREKAEAEYRFYKKHGRPIRPYHVKNVETGQSNTIEDSLLNAHWHAMRRRGGIEYVDEVHAEIALLDDQGRELERYHTFYREGEQPPQCSNCGAEPDDTWVSCPECGYIEDDDRLRADGGQPAAESGSEVARRDVAGEHDRRSNCALCGQYLDDIERATTPMGLCWGCKP